MEIEKPEVVFSAALNNIKIYREKLDHTNRTIKKARMRVSQLKKNIADMTKNDVSEPQPANGQFIISMKEEIQEWNNLIEEQRIKRNEIISLIGEANIDDQYLEKAMEADDKAGHA